MSLLFWLKLKKAQVNKIEEALETTNDLSKIKAIHLYPEQKKKKKKKRESLEKWKKKEFDFQQLSYNYVKI